MDRTNRARETPRSAVYCRMSRLGALKKARELLQGTTQYFNNNLQLKWCIESKEQGKCHVRFCVGFILCNLFTWLIYLEETLVYLLKYIVPKALRQLDLPSNSQCDLLNGKLRWRCARNGGYSPPNLIRLLVLPYATYSNSLYNLYQHSCTRSTFHYTNPLILFPF